MTNGTNDVPATQPASGNRRTIPSTRMSDMYTTDRVPGERARVVAQGRSTDDNSTCTLIVVHELDGGWTIHVLGAPGVRLSKAVAVAVAEAILASAR